MTYSEWMAGKGIAEPISAAAENRLYRKYLEECGIDEEGDTNTDDGHWALIY